MKKRIIVVVIAAFISVMAIASALWYFANENGQNAIDFDNTEDMMELPTPTPDQSDSRIDSLLSDAPADSASIEDKRAYYNEIMNLGVLAGRCEDVEEASEAKKSLADEPLPLDTLMIARCYFGVDQNTAKLEGYFEAARAEARQIADKTNREATQTVLEGSISDMKAYTQQ